MRRAVRARTILRAQRVDAVGPRPLKLIVRCHQTLPFVPRYGLFPFRLAFFSSLRPYFARSKGPVR